MRIVVKRSDFLQHSELRRMISDERPVFRQASYMDAFHPNQNPLKQLSLQRRDGCDRLRSRLRQWQQVRTWARLIREAESLWHVDVRELRRLGAVELSQLLQEVPPAQRHRVNRWLVKYSVSTRFQGKHSVLDLKDE